MMNEGTYGKALARYLQEKLQERGCLAPFVGCENWGWWVELKNAPFTFGVCALLRASKNGLTGFVLHRRRHGSENVELVQIQIRGHHPTGFKVT